MTVRRFFAAWWAARRRLRVPADDLGSELGTVFVDDLDGHFEGRSGSAAERAGPVSVDRWPGEARGSPAPAPAPWCVLPQSSSGRARCPCRCRPARPGRAVAPPLQPVWSVHLLGRPVRRAELLAPSYQSGSPCLLLGRVPPPCRPPRRALASPDPVLVSKIRSPQATQDDSDGPGRAGRRPRHGSDRIPTPTTPPAQHRPVRPSRRGHHRRVRHRGSVELHHLLVRRGQSGSPGGHQRDRSGLVMGRAEMLHDPVDAAVPGHDLHGRRPRRGPHPPQERTHPPDPTPAISDPHHPPKTS